MIKLIVFDLDGVLIDSRDIHYHALNKALETIDQRFSIPYNEHLAKYDGLNTTAKLEKLTIDKGFPKELHDAVWKLKQEMTSEVFKTHLKPNAHITYMLQSLKQQGYIIYCASNSIWTTIRDALLYTGYIQYFDWFISNQDVLKPKPSPCIYLACLKRANVSANECLICEDSPIGLKAARGSGAHVCQILDVPDLTLSKVEKYIYNITTSDIHMTTHTDHTDHTVHTKRDINIVIPMAGNGSRFSQAGYKDPKPMIIVEGKPMIQRVIENIGVHNGHFIFILQKAHDDIYGLSAFLSRICPGCKVVYVDRVTEGAACSVLLAESLIDNNTPMLLANSDQLVDWGGKESVDMCADSFIYKCEHKSVDGGISVFDSTDPKFSFAKVDSVTGWVSEVAEKRAISNTATTGIYYWKHGSDFVKYAKEMMAANIRVNNEFYVCPVYNQAIADGKMIRQVSCDRFHCLGTPEDLEVYLNRSTC